MKFYIVILLVATVFGKIVLADTLECYECIGEKCNDNPKVTVCTVDTVATPKPTQPPVTTEPTTTTTSVGSLQKYSSISRQRRATSEFACYTVSYNAGTKTLRKKGCVENTVNACNIATDGVTDPLEACVICRESKCNSSAAIKLSVASAILVFFIMLLK